MENKNTLWGEMYDTLYEMKDELKDESFLKCLQLVDSLEKSSTLVEIKNSIDSYPLTTYELNRFNSLCLDGIINTIDNADPLLALIRTSNIRSTLSPKGDNFQTFVYYFGKKFCSTKHIAEICLFGRTEMLEYILFRKSLPEDTKTPNNYSIDHECCYIFRDISIYDKKHDIITAGSIAAAKGYMDMVKLIFEKLHCCCNVPLHDALSAKNTEIARYILERTYEHQKKGCDECNNINDIFVILCTYGNLELIQYMIDKNWVDLKPETYALVVGIDEAQYYNQLHVAKFLEENYGGKVGAFSYYNGIQDNSFLYYNKN